MVVSRTHFENIMSRAKSLRRPAELTSMVRGFAKRASLGSGIEILKFAPQALLAAQFVHSCLEGSPQVALLPFILPLHRISQAFSRFPDPRIILADVNVLNAPIETHERGNRSVAAFVFNERIFMPRERFASGKIRGLIEHEKAHILGASEALAWKLGFKSVLSTKFREFKNLTALQSLSLLYYLFPTFMLNVISSVYGISGLRGDLNQSNFHKPDIFFTNTVPGRPLTSYRRKIIQLIEDGKYKPNLYETAIVLMWKGKYNAARVALLMHNEKTGGNARSYAALAGVNEKLDLKKEALSAYQKALSLCKENDSLREALEWEMARASNLPD